MTIFKKLILLALIFIGSHVFAQTSTTQPISTTGNQKGDAAGTAKVTVTPDTILASNATVKVTKADFDAEMSRIPETERFEFLLSRPRIAMLLENILVNKVLAQEAVELKIDQNPLVKDEILNQTEKVLAKYRAQRILQQTNLRDFNSAAREAYLADPKKSVKPARYKPWHILVSLVGRDKATAQKRAQEARARVLKGDSLEEIAKEYSDDPSVKKNDGILDLSEPTEFEIPFADAIKKMKPGDTSDVVETRFGFHVIYLLEYLPEEKISYELMKPILLEEARLAYLKSSLDNHLNRIKLDPNLKIDADALDVIRPRIPENVKPIYTAPPTIKAPPRKVSNP